MLARSVDARVGELVRFWLYRRGIQQSDLAEILDITPAAISRKVRVSGQNVLMGGG